MSESGTVMVSMRIPRTVHAAYKMEGQSIGLDPVAAIQRAVHIHAVEAGYLEPEDEACLQAQQKVADAIVALAVRLYKEGRFTPAFTRLVFQEAMNDPVIKADYEVAVGGPALAKGLPGKAPFNMNMGNLIKKAIGAKTVLDEEGRLRRANVRGEAIQSYTLLRMPDAA